MFKYYKRNAVFFGGSHYFRIENERKEYFYVLIKEPNSLGKWMLGEKYCVIEDAAIPPILCQILESSNLKSLTTNFWMENRMKIPVNLYEFICFDLQFDGQSVETKRNELLRDTLNNYKHVPETIVRLHKDKKENDKPDDSSIYITPHHGDFNTDFLSTDSGSSWSDNSQSSSDDSSSSSSFDFGGGDSGGGGAGGDY